MHLLGAATTQFVQCATSKLDSFLASNSVNTDDCPSDEVDTWLYPVLQIGSFNVDQEHQIMKDFFVSTSSSDKIYLSTAYFNPLNEYAQLISERSTSRYHLLTASPQVSNERCSHPLLLCALCKTEKPAQSIKFLISIFLACIVLLQKELQRAKCI